MFDQVETFSSNSLHDKQMFDRLATLSHEHKAFQFWESGKKQPITSGISCVGLRGPRVLRYNFSRSRISAITH